MKKCLLSLAFVAILLGLVGCEPLQPVVPTIQLEPSSLELFVGQKDTLVAIVSPEDLTVDCIWESSDTKVATVNKNGVVSAKGEGEAIITLTTPIGIAQCVVNVLYGTLVMDQEEITCQM